VICVFHDERVVATHVELDEDLIVVERAAIGRIHDLGAVASAPRHRSKDCAHEASFPGAGRPLQHENRLARAQVLVDQWLHRPQCRIGFIEQVRVGELVDCDVCKARMCGREVPVDRKDLFTHALWPHDVEEVGAHRIDAHDIFGPDLEDAGAVVGLPLALTNTPVAVEQQRRRI
jgi:hypothetical protein